MGRWDEDPFLREGPVVPAPEGPVQRHVKAGVYGATLGFFPRQFQPEGTTETIAEIAGSIPTYAAASALGAGPAAAAIRGATGLRAGYAAGSAAVAAGLGATVEGGKAAISGEENPFIAAAKGAAIQGGLEYLGLKGYAKFTKSGRAAAAAEKAASTTRADDVVRASSETPTPAAVDVATTRVPDTPTIQPGRPLTLADLMQQRSATSYGRVATGPPVIAPGGPRTLGDIVDTMVDDVIHKPLRQSPGGASFPTTPREFTASYGPKIDAEDHVSGLPVIETDPGLIEKARGLFRAGEQVTVAKVQVQMGLDDAKARAVVNALKTGISQGRVRLDHFVDNPQAVWTPSGIPSSGPSDIAVRTELERRFTPGIVRSAESMTEQEFTKYAIQDPVAREVIKAGQSDPQSVWTLVDVYKDRPGPGGGSFNPVGKTPMFTETFDETLGKKVLVPLNDEAGGWVDALKMSPSPRHLELQLGADQLQYFKSPKGLEMIKQMDVVTNNQPFLTSNILKQSDEAIERIIHETDPINIIQPSVIQRTTASKTLDTVKKEVATGANMTEKQIDEVFAAVDRDVTEQLGALRGLRNLKQPLTTKERALNEALQEAFLKRCRENG